MVKEVASSTEQLKAAAFDALMANDDLGLAILDHDLRYISINDTLARFNGVSAQQHLGQRVREILPDLAPIIEPMLQQVLDTGTGHMDFEISGETPSLAGEESVWQGSYIPIFRNSDPQQPVDGILVVAENLTLLNQLSQARIDANALVRRVIDSLFSFVGVLTLDGTLIDANRPPLDAAGIKAEDVMGLKFWDCPWWNHDPDTQQRLKQSIEQALKGETVRYEVEIQIANNERMLIDFMMAPLMDDAGRITHLIPSAIDISDRARSERQLKASEERFRRVVDSTADGLLLVDADGNIQLANNRATEMFGYPLEELMALRVEQLIPPHTAIHHAELRQQYLANPEKRTMAARRELFAMRKDGSQFPVEIGLTPMEFDKKQITLATIMDVTIQKSIQQELQLALDEKTSLLNEVHHRVKNNLQVVSSLLSLQTRKVPEEVRGHFTESQDRIRAMALIHQLLYEQSHYDRIDVVAYAGRLLELVKRSYLSSVRGIDLSVESNQEQIHIPLDVAQPFGLFMNEVITNSVKHAFPKRRGGYIRVMLVEREAEVAVVVEDNGVGLPEGVRPGTGGSLGFQLIVGLVEQMDGKLITESDTGVRFTLTLAKAAEEQGSKA
ncbi:PAS domain S-box protein [Oceanobacter kriegii]|uniref:PAS domain S-box protein n=1 Tax=Oceanobacter kriegii TaxID=64972 RepID=UPI000400288E|nr:PAS domain S-box protein [Oceanobacter kriegii]